MGKVVLDITMSIDGFIAGLNDDVKQSLHGWLFNGNTPCAYSDFFHLSKKSAKVFDDLIKNTGAIIAGKRTYDITGGWGGSHPFPNVPMFIVTHDIPKYVPKGSTPFIFVTDGIESAVRQAKKSAGKKWIYVLGGASIAQQCIKAKLIDEMMIHLVPVLLGDGIRLLDNLGDRQIKLEHIKTVEAPGVVHLRFCVIKTSVII